MRTVLSIVFAGVMLTSGAAFAQTEAEKEACKADFEKYCQGVEPGGGRIIECLSQHMDKLTPECQAAVKANMPK
jgi:hypothetical protein